MEHSTVYNPLLRHKELNKDLVGEAAIGLDNLYVTCNQGHVYNAVIEQNIICGLE